MPTPPLSEARFHRHVPLPHLPSPFSYGLETASPMLTPVALEPLGFRPSCFSQFSSLLIPTFSDLMSFSSLYPQDHSRHPLPSTDRSPTAMSLPTIAYGFGGVLQSLVLRCDSPRSARCNTFIIGWLLPSLPPDCLRLITPFHTTYAFGALSISLGCLPLNAWYFSTIVELTTFHAPTSFAV